MHSGAGRVQLQGLKFRNPPAPPTELKIFAELYKKSGPAGQGSPSAGPHGKNYN